MTADRDDAPPGEASTALAMAAAMLLTTSMRPADGWRGIRDALPTAARWRLIGWLATGLEPTEAMARASRITTNNPDGSRTHTWGVNVLPAMLAAAREARDE